MSIKKLGVCGDSYMSAISYNENDLDNDLSTLKYFKYNCKYRFHTTIEYQEFLSNKWCDFLKLNNLI